MKALKPSQREKKRYLLIKGKDFRKNVKKAILDFIGILGYSKVGLSFVKPEAAVAKDSAIICINREAVNEVRAAICVSSEKMSVEKISGTLKGLTKK